VADIYDYFFGDPTRLLVKRRAWEEELRRQAQMPDLVNDYIMVLGEAAQDGNLVLVQHVVSELRQLVKFGTDSKIFKRGAQAARDTASACGHWQVAEYLGCLV
jgi:hypothetical protein